MKKVIGISSICLGIVAVVTGLCLFFLNNNSNKETIFSDAISASANNIKTIINNDNMKEDSGWSESLKSKYIKFTTNNSIILDDGVITFNGDIYGNEKEDLLMDLIVDSGLDKYNYQLIQKDKTIYFTIVDVLEKYYTMENQPTSDNEVSKALIKFVDILSESIIDRLNNDVEEEDTTLMINKKGYDVTKYSCYFSSKDLANILIDSLNKVKKDKDFDGFISFLEENDMSLDALIEELEDSLDEIKDDDKLIKYSIYKKGDDIVDNEITVTISNVPLTISSINLDDYSAFKVSMLENDLVSLEMVKKSEKITEISAEIANIMKITGISEINEDMGTANISLSGVDNKNNEIFKFVLSLVTSEKDETGELNITLDVSGKTMLESKTTINVVDSMPEVDVSNNAPFEEMTEKDKEIISSLFGTVETLIPNDVEV